MRSVIFFIAVFLFMSCRENKKDKPADKNDTQASSEKKDNKYFPFILKESDGEYLITADIEGPALHPKYTDFFQKNGYEGNGPCWEGHVEQILEKTNRDLLEHLEFDSEAGGFYAFADSKENQIKIAEIISPIFSDMNKLEEWVKKADRARIDD
jgi:hypothetical protein